jgi:transposase
VVSSTGARFGVNLISAISAQGQLRFMLTKGRVTAAVFIDFLKRLLINASAPASVIVDGHPTHRAKSVARFMATQAGKLAVYILSPYSPELNPDELVWNDLSLGAHDQDHRCACPLRFPPASAVHMIRRTG